MGQRDPIVRDVLPASEQPATIYPSKTVSIETGGDVSLTVPNHPDFHRATACRPVTVDFDQMVVDEWLVCGWLHNPLIERP